MKNHLYTLLLTQILFCACSEKGTSTAPVNDSTSDSITAIDTIKTVTNNLVATDEYLITDTSFGTITSATTYNELVKLFGKNNLKDEMGYGAEGMDSFIVTKVFSDTPKEIVISWKENKLHKKIAEAECYQEKAPYHTTDSLKIGSTLQKLLQVNGKQINFTGTSWDYGGFISSFNKGRLEKSKLFFQLTGTEGMDERLMGDQELNTSMPLVKRNLTNIYISKISLLFK